MKGYVITDTSMGGFIVSDWADNGDGTESPDVGTAREKAREILDCRVAHLLSRVDNLESIDDDEPDDLLGEACDDLQFGFEPVEIAGEGPDAVMTFLDLDQSATLRELSERAGRNLPIRWPPPIDSPPSE
jgi:hypothetical protein